MERLRSEFSSKEREMEAENFELKKEVAKVLAEIEAIHKEQKDLMDAKLLEVSLHLHSLL